MPVAASLTVLWMTVLAVPVQLKPIPEPPLRFSIEFVSTSLPLPLRMIPAKASDTWFDLMVLEFPSAQMPTVKFSTVLPVTVEDDGKAIPVPARDSWRSRMRYHTIVRNRAQGCHQFKPPATPQGRLF